MAVPKIIQDIEQGVQKAQEFLASADQTIRQLAGSDLDVNARPAGSSGGVLDEVQSTLTNVQRAAQLRQMLPWVFVAGGILLGRPVLGIALAVVVHLAGAPPAAAR